MSASQISRKSILPASYCNSTSSVWTSLSRHPFPVDLCWTLTFKTLQSPEPVWSLLCLHLPTPQVYELTSVFFFCHSSIPCPWVMTGCTLSKNTHHGLLIFVSPAPGMRRARSAVRRGWAGKHVFPYSLWRTTFTSLNRQTALLSQDLCIYWSFCQNPISIVSPTVPKNFCEGIGSS